MDGPDSPEFTHALNEASARAQTLHAELLSTYPPLRGSLAIPGMLMGHGLGSFVANGMTDDQILTHVLVVVAQIRQALGALKAAPDLPDDDAAVH